MEKTVSRRAMAVGGVIWALIVVQPARASSEGNAATPAGAAPATASHAELKDLGVLDFFTEGWSDAWVHRHRATRDMALLKVTTNFLERELRLDFAYTSLRDNPRFTGTYFANSLMAYAVNRRLMLEIIANYQWNVAPGAAPVNGAGAALLARLQLVDTATASYSVQMRVSAPNKGLGTTQTTMGYYLAAWHDVGNWIPALGRVGLYFSFEYDNLLGPHATGATQNSMSYDISLARTWTRDGMPVVGDLTTFLEIYGTTALDGKNAWKTVLSLTPGLRFWFLPKNSFTFGVELPVSHSPAYWAIWRTTYILNF